MRKEILKNQCLLKSEASLTRTHHFKPRVSYWIHVQYNDPLSVNIVILVAITFRYIDNLASTFWALVAQNLYYTIESLLGGY